MEMDRTALKKQLLEIARREALKYGEDITTQMRKTVKLEKNLPEKWVKIIYIGKEGERSSIDKESFEDTLVTLTDGEIPEYEIIEDPDYVQFQFQEEGIVDKVYNHYYQFFFGNMQQQVVESFLTKYIDDLMDDGCDTGSCGCSGGSCGAHGHAHDED